MKRKPDYFITYKVLPPNSRHKNPMKSYYLYFLDKSMRRRKYFLGVTTKAEAILAAAEAWNAGICVTEARQEEEPTLKGYYYSNGVPLFSTKSDYGMMHAAIGRKISASYLAECNRTMERYWLPAFGGLKLSKITDDMIYAKQTKLLNKGLSPKSVKNILLNLSIVLKEAVRQKVLKESPMRNMMKIRLDATLTRFGSFPKEVWERLFIDCSCWSSSIFYAFNLMAFFTGMRAGELLSLRGQDFDPSNNTLYVSHSFNHGELGPTKTRNCRTVPLTCLGSSVIRILIAFNRNGFIFSINGGKSPSAQTTMLNQQKNALRTLGYTDGQISGNRWCLHSYRHTFTSLLVEKGISDPLISQVTGHASKNLSEMNARYTHQTAEGFEIVRKAIESFLPQETQSVISKNMKDFFTVRKPE